MLKSLKLQGRALYLYFPFTLLILSFVAGCQKEREHKDSLHQTISSFVNTFDYYLADSIALSKVDTIGELVLTLPNSRANREIIKNFIDKTKPNKVYSDQLYNYGLEDSDSSSVADALYLKSEYYSRKIMMDSSFFYLSQAERLFLELNDSLDLSQVYLRKAILLTKNGVFSEAEKHIDRSINYNPTTISERTKAVQFMFLGEIFSGLEMLDDALHFYNRALNILNTPSISAYMLPYDINLNKVYIYDSIARLYIKQGKYKQARELLLKTIDNYIDHSNITSERYYAFAAIDLARVKMLEKDYEDVEELLKQTLRIGIKNSNKILINNSKLGLAEYLYATNQIDKAKIVLDEVQETVRRVGDFDSQLKALEILIAYDSVNVERYFVEYKEINRQNKDEANILRNYFIRIKNEADLLNTVNRDLNAKNKLLMIMGGSLVLVLCTILFIYLYQSKIRKVGLSKMFQRDTEHYYNSIINIQNSLALVKDRERGLIAKELNDGVINRLFAARFSLIQLEGEHIDHQKDLLINEIVEVEKYIREVSHTIVNEGSIQIQEFEQLLRELVLMQKKQSLIDFTIQFDQQLNLEELSHRKKINIYRSIQEVLINVHLHSFAQSCKISFSYKDTTSFEVRIVDDGVGFDTRSIRKGYGLLHIKERLEMIEGKLLVNSKPKEGTTYLFIISS